MLFSVQPEGKAPQRWPIHWISRGLVLGPIQSEKKVGLKSSKLTKRGKFFNYSKTLSSPIGIWDKVNLCWKGAEQGLGLVAAIYGKMCVLSTFKLNLVQTPALQNGDGNFMELGFSLNIFVPFAFTQITRVLKTASNSHFYWHGCYRSCPEKGWKDMTELAAIPSHGVGISVPIQALLMNRSFLCLEDWFLIFCTHMENVSGFFLSG